MLTRVVPCSEMMRTEMRPLPVETVMVALCRALLFGADDVTRNVRSAHPSGRLISVALKLRPAMSCSMARSAWGSGPPQRRKLASWAVPSLLVESVVMVVPDAGS